jgi:hypothetical protein
MAVFIDDISSYDGGASTDACDAVNQNIGMFSRFLDESCACWKVLGNIEGLFVLSG